MPMPMMQAGRRSHDSRLMELSRHGINNGGPPPPKKPRYQNVLPISPVEMVESPTASPGARQNLFSNLPDECIYLIFSFIPFPRDRCSCSAVSRKWLFLQAHMRPSDLRCPSAATNTTSLPSDIGNDSADQRKRGPKASRCLDSFKASDARLASMAVGACARPALTELTIRTNFFQPPSGSSLLNVTNVGLRAISQACPKLRRLTLWQCNMVGNEGLDAIASRCPALKELYVFHAPLLGDDGVARVAMNCPKLSVISMWKCPLVGNAALRALARWSSNLESISLDRCPLMSDAGLVALFSSLPRLANVTVAHAKVGDGALDAVGARGPGSRIQKLCLENVSGFTHQGFHRLLLAANLESLYVRSCAGINSSCLIANRDSRTVCCWLPLSQATQHVGLRHITVKSCENFSNEELVGLSEVAKHLESFQLERCHGVTTAGLLRALRNWSGSLKSLSLLECNGIRGEQGLQVPLPNRCRVLHCLEIKKCPGVGDEFLELMGTIMAKAKRVALVRMSSVTDWGIISLLASMEHRNVVHSIDLSGCGGVTDWTVAALASTSGRSLRRLILEGCVGVTDSSLKLIGLLCPRLVELDLTGCWRISDGGVAALLAQGEGGSASAAVAVDGGGAATKKSGLEVLSLEGCEGITDECLGMLEEMVVQGNLVGLNLKQCAGLSRANVDAVRQALWWCDLIY